MRRSIATALRIASAKTERNPSDKAKESGRYAKGVFDWRGINIAIENPKGSERSGVDKGGKRWSVTMPCTYGEFKKSEGADGDAVDVFIGSAHDSDKVFILDQIDAKTKAFDEHKVFVDFPSKEAALSTYEKAFSDGKGKDRIGAVTTMGVETFKSWLKNDDTTEAVGHLKRADGGRIPPYPGDVSGFAGGGSPGWRQRAAPYGLQQLAARLGYSVDDLIANPRIVAAAVAQMEDPRGAKQIAESFMDMVDRNGGGEQGLMKTVAGYDTMTMASPRQIGSLWGGDTNATIAQLNSARMQPTLQHLSDVGSGAAQRVLPEGYTQNFSPAAARVQPIRPGSWQYYRDPSGKSIYAPTWAQPAVTAGKYTMTPSGEYMVPGDLKPFSANWSKVASGDAPSGPFASNSSITPPLPSFGGASAPKDAQPVGLTNVAPVASAAPIFNDPVKNSPTPDKGSWFSSLFGGSSAPQPESKSADWVDGPLGLMPKWGDDPTALQGFAAGGPIFDKFSAPPADKPFPEDWSNRAFYPEVNGMVEQGKSPWTPVEPDYTLPDNVLHPDQLRGRMRYTREPKPPTTHFADGGSPVYPGDDPDFLSMLKTNPHGWGNSAPLPVWQREPLDFQGSISNTADRPTDPIEAPIAESLSPTMGGYGAGQAAGETINALRDQDWGKAAEFGLPLAAMAVAPGMPKGVRGVPRELNEAGFYSPTLEAAKGLPQQSGTVQQFRSMLLDPKYGGKPKELEAVGFDKQFPDPNAKVSRSDIEEFLRGNRVGLGQKTYKDLPDDLGGDAPQEWGADGRPRFDTWSTPGGIPGSYREVVTTLPDTSAQQAKQAWQSYRASLLDKYGRDSGALGRATPEERARDKSLEDAMYGPEGMGGRYTSSHWPGVTNPIAHRRTKSFKNEDGTITQVEDEWQSDAAQRRRDVGTRDPAKAQALQADLEKVKAEHADYDKQIRKIETDTLAMHLDPNTPFDIEKVINYPADPRAKKLEAMREEIMALKAKRQDSGNRIMDLSNKVNAAMHDGVPDLAFTHNTSDWVDLLAKQALKQAADDPSVSRLAWAPGGVQGPRYPRYAGETAEAFEKRRLGQIGFYGDFTPEGSYNPGIVGTRLLKLLKALDPEAAKIEPHGNFYAGEKFPVYRADGTLEGTYLTEDHAAKIAKKIGGKMEVPKRPYPSITITPKMREAIKKGLPLFLALGAAGMGEQEGVPDVGFARGGSIPPFPGDEAKLTDRPPTSDQHKVPTNPTVPLDDWWNGIPGAPGFHLLTPPPPHDPPTAPQPAPGNSIASLLHRYVFNGRSS